MWARAWMYGWLIGCESRECQNVFERDVLDVGMYLIHTGVQWMTRFARFANYHLHRVHQVQVDVALKRMRPCL